MPGPELLGLMSGMNVSGGGWGVPSRPDGRKRRLRLRRRRRREGDRSRPAAGPRVARRLRRRPGRDPPRPRPEHYVVLFGALMQALRMRAFNVRLVR
jgi:hypothetical protein